MEEIWRSIKDYEGLYEVSNWGRVRSLDHQCNKKIKRGRILKPNTCTIYPTVVLHKDGIQKGYLVHRLVGLAFPDLVGWTEDAIGKPFEELEINHKDEDKLNNRFDNLEWCSHSYNINYGTRNKRTGNKNSVKLLNNEKLSKKVNQYTLDGTLVETWSSISEIHRQLGYSTGFLCDILNGKYKNGYGYKWIYI